MGHIKGLEVSCKTAVGSRARKAVVTRYVTHNCSVMLYAAEYNSGICIFHHTSKTFCVHWEKNGRVTQLDRDAHNTTYGRRGDLHVAC